jgi:hypothetical protein
VSRAIPHEPVSSTADAVGLLGVLLLVRITGMHIDLIWSAATARRRPGRAAAC